MGDNVKAIMQMEAKNPYIIFLWKSCFLNFETPRLSYLGLGIFYWTLYFSEAKTFSDCRESWSRPGNSVREKHRDAIFSINIDSTKGWILPAWFQQCCELQDILREYSTKMH